jgi:hypothetical protein
LALSGLAGQAAAAETRAPLVRKPARHVIFVLMSGAPSQLETFDPKPGAPTGGPFGTIATRIPGVRFCEYLPRLAAMSDQFAVVRSVNGPAPGGDHVADLRCTLTGHYGKGNVGVARPSFGSIVAHQLGRPDAKLPGYVNLSPSWHEAAFQGPGCLGARYDMLKLPGYGKLAGATARPDGVSDEGFRARQELRDALGRLAGRAPEVRVVCPILPSRAHYIASDIDRELAEARRRLDATLAWAREHGFDAAGRVGDDTPPMTAIEDELRRFPADELLISTHPPGRSHWLELGLVEQAREQLDMTVTHVVVDLARQRVEIRPDDPELAARQAVGYGP